MTAPECWSLRGMVPGLFVIKAKNARAQLLIEQLGTHRQFERPIRYFESDGSRELYIKVISTAIPSHAAMHLNRYIGMARFDEVEVVRCSKVTYEQAKQSRL